MARLIDRRRAEVPVTSMGFSMCNPMELLKPSRANDEDMGAIRITDWLSQEVFETNFWSMWVTTFAFQPWRSAVEYKRYLHRFMLEFTHIETHAGVKRTVFNQYGSLARAARMAVSERMGVDRKVPPATPRDKDLSVQFEALAKALRQAPLPKRAAQAERRTG